MVFLRVGGRVRDRRTRPRRAAGGNEEAVVTLSARNQLPGTVKSVVLGSVMAEVVVDVAGYEVAAAVTRNSAETLGLSAGDDVKVVIKATEVMIDK
jgi:molybdate transport system regulatory protein